MNDNAWTSVLRDQNNGGGGLGELRSTWPPAVNGWPSNSTGRRRWLDAGVIYWDYNPDAPAGQRLNGGVGFPEILEDPIDSFDAELLYIPDTHLRGAPRTLVSADLVGTVTANELGLEFEIDGDQKKTDRLVLDNPDDQVYTTILDIDGLKFHVAASGNFQVGDSFPITNANQVMGTPEVVTPMWRFDAASGSPGSFWCGRVGRLQQQRPVGFADPDFLIAAIGTNDSRYDVNGDGTVTDADLKDWVKRPDYANTWAGATLTENSRAATSFRFGR